MRQRLLLLLLLLAGWGARAQTLLQSQSFENGETVNYTASTVYSGNSNIYFYRANLPVPGFLSTSTVTNIRDTNGNSGGTYFWASENVRRNPDQGANAVRYNPPANLTMSAINVAGKSGFSVRVALADAAANNTSGTGWEIDDFVRIQYRFDGNAGTWTNATGGQFVGTYDPNTGVQVFGQLKQDTNGDGVADGAALTQALTDYTFAIPGSGTTLEVRVQVDQDGASEEFGFDAIRVYGSAAASAPPVLSGIESGPLAYKEKDPATNITTGLTISDDGTMLSGATVAISSNYQSSEDQLIFINTSNIFGSYNSGTGVLTLSGTTTISNYQTALRSIQYYNSDKADASPLTRTVSFNVTDATGVGSNTVARNITVATALDAPGGLPYAEDLENGDGEGTRYATNKSTAVLISGRYFNRTNVASEPGGQWHSSGSAATTISGINNSYYWWASGTSVLSGGVGTFTTKQTNTAGYVNLVFSVKLAASNNVWENGQYLKVYYRLTDSNGNSGSWQPLLSFRSTDQTTTTSQASTTGNLRQDANPATTTGVPTGAQLTPTLTPYSATLPAQANGQLVDFKIEALSIAADGVGEVIAFDNLQLTGTQIVPPAVTTGTVGTTTTASASVNNNTLTNDGGATINDYGVVYVAGTGTPTKANSKVQAGTTSPGSFPASFSVNITGLLPGTTYTAAAYASNSAGDRYGSNVTFTTPPNAPAINAPANNSTLTTRTPVYSGTAQAGSTVTVSLFNVSTGTTTTLGSTTATGGNFTLTQPASLADGQYRVSATATIGNSAASAASTAVTFNIDATAPVVSSVAVPANGTYRAGQNLDFTVNFSEAVTVTTTGGTPSIGLTVGTASRTASYVSGSGSSALVFRYTVASGDLDTDGITLGTLALNGSTIQDAVGNNANLTLNSVPSTASVLVDAVAPTVVSSVRQNPATATTSATSLTFRVTFSEAVTGVTTGSFTLVTTTGATTGTIASVAAVSGSTNTQFDVTVNSVSGNGAVRLDVKSSGSGITDPAGNALNGGYSSGEVYTINQSVSVSSIAQVTPSPTATTQVTYRVTFSGAVAGLQASNFGFTDVTNLSPSVTSVTSVGGSTSVYDVVVTTGALTNSASSGTLRLTVANSTGTTPAISLPAPTAPLYTITRSFAAAPTLRIQAAGSASNNGDVTAFVDVVQVLQSGTSTAVPNGLQNNSFENNNVSAGSFLKTPDGVVAAPWNFTGLSGVSRNGSAFASTAFDGDAVALVQSAGDNNASISQNLAVPTGSYQVRFQAIQRNYTSKDQRLNVFVNNVFVGNIQPNNTPTYDTFTSAAFNVTAPALTATVSTTSASPTSTSPIPFSVSFSQSVGTTFTASDVTVTGGTLTSGSFSGSGSGPYTFTVTPSGAGTVTVSLAGGVATDANNTPNTASNSVSVQYQLLVTDTPTLNTPASGITNNNRPIFSGTAPANSTVTLYLNGSPASFPIGSSGTFAVQYASPLADGTYTAYVTAQRSGSTVSANSNTVTFTIDTTAPTVTLSSSTVPTNGGSTSTSPVNFTATFSEAVTGFTSAGIQVNGGSVTSGPTAGSGNTYTFQVTPSGAGTVAVQVLASAARDQATNGNTASASYSFTFIAPTITVAPTTSTLLDGTQGTSYSVMFSATGGSGSYSYTISGTPPPGLSLSGSTLSGTPTASGTFNFRITATDNSAAPGPYSGFRDYTITIAAPAVTSVGWNGNVNTDWFTASNWTPNQVPDATIDAIIPTAPSGNRFPVISANASQANARNVSIASGASLSMSANTLIIAANLTNNGTFNGFTGSGSTATGGTVMLGGSAQALLNGGGVNNFWNLTVGTNTAQLNNPNATSVRRVLTLNGNFATNNNAFTMVSDASGTALVVNNGTAVITGAATFQRYIDPSANRGLGYRHFAAPTSNATVASLATGSFSPVVNPVYNTSPTPAQVQPFPTVYGYDQARLATASNNLAAFDKGWFSPTTTGDALTVGRGYTVNLSAGQTFSLTGPQNNAASQPLTLTLARNAVGTPNAGDAGFHLVGNPFPSPLDWGQVAATDRTNLDPAAYVYTSNGQYTGYYRTILNGVGGSSILPMGQGFFVHVADDASSATLNFRNSQRVMTYTNPAYQRTAETRPLVQLTLQGVGSPLADDAYVYFENGATDGYEPAYDALKLPNPTGLNLSTSLPGKQLAIDGRLPLGSTQRVVPLAVGVPAVGAYTFTASQLLNLSTVPTYLHDRQTGAMIDLSQQPSYQFTVSDASALITGRFELVFSPQQLLATSTAALAQQVALYPNPAKTAAFVALPASLGRQAVTATLVDALGRVVRTVVLPAQGAVAHPLDLHELATGVYALRLSTSAGTVVKRLTIE